MKYSGIFITSVEDIQEIPIQIQNMFNYKFKIDLPNKKEREEIINK